MQLLLTLLSMNWLIAALVPEQSQWACRWILYTDMHKSTYSKLIITERGVARDYMCLYPWVRPGCSSCLQPVPLSSSLLTYYELMCGWMNGHPCKFNREISNWPEPDTWSSWKLTSGTITLYSSHRLSGIFMLALWLSMLAIINEDEHKLNLSMQSLRMEEGMREPVTLSTVLVTRADCESEIHRKKSLS